MPDAQLIPHPVFSPGACFFCGGPEGPVVDTMVDLVGDGRIYVCARTCLPLWAGLAGLLSAEEASRLGQALESAMGEIDALRGELERERESKVVSVSDMVSLIDRVRGQSIPRAVLGATPTTSAEEMRELQGGVLLDTWRQLTQEGSETGQSIGELHDLDHAAIAAPTCTATKVNGERCTADALPGRDVCLAHSKRKAGVV